MDASSCTFVRPHSLSLCLRHRPYPPAPHPRSRWVNDKLSPDFCPRLAPLRYVPRVFTGHLDGGRSPGGCGPAQGARLDAGARSGRLSQAQGASRLSVRSKSRDRPPHRCFGPLHPFTAAGENGRGDLVALVGFGGHWCQWWAVTPPSLTTAWDEQWTAGQELSNNKPLLPLFLCFHPSLFPLHLNLISSCIQHPDLTTTCHLQGSSFPPAIPSATALVDSSSP